MLASPGTSLLALMRSVTCMRQGIGVSWVKTVPLLLMLSRQVSCKTPYGLPRGKTHCVTRGTAGTTCAAVVLTPHGAVRAQGVAHRGAGGGTADVHLAPPPGDGWLPREDTAVQQPPMARMVSWQDAHGKDLYTVRALSYAPHRAQCSCGDMQCFDLAFSNAAGQAYPGGRACWLRAARSCAQAVSNELPFLCKPAVPQGKLMNGVVRGGQRRASHRQVREFEPSEGGITEDEMPWERPRACCRLM